MLKGLMRIHLSKQKPSNCCCLACILVNRLAKDKLGVPRLTCVVIVLKGEGRLVSRNSSSSDSWKTVLISLGSHGILFPTYDLLVLSIDSSDSYLPSSCCLSCQHPPDEVCQVASIMNKWHHSLIPLVLVAGLS